MRKFGVLIGRFQPFHLAHLETIRFALQRVQTLIIVIGSSNQARSVKNPWTSDERVAMIAGSLTTDERERIKVIEARDYLYNDNLWITAIQEKVAELTDDENDDIVVIGHKKDNSSFYLRLFPQWEFIETNITMELDASTVRDLMFRQDKIGIKHLLPDFVYGHVKNFMDGDVYAQLHEEYQHLARYRRSWEGAPFPPTFVTVDAVVVGLGHVLVVRRKASPGRGLIALPGGFLNQRERIIDGAIRELKEETGIRLSEQELRDAIVDEKIFDHPDRSLRGRTITHGFCMHLDPKTGRLPRVKGDDDADKSWWMPLREVAIREHEFFEDHYHIINYFTSRR
jgi:bifunctional NMN adenylyltransferase/nudix hydrolase